jgi:hypothetical protein
MGLSNKSAMKVSSEKQGGTPNGALPELKSV